MFRSYYSVFKVRLWWCFLRAQFPVTPILHHMVGQNGLEPSTSRLSVVCSSQLSYWPMWWRLRESNPWPPACKAGALPAELNPHIRFWVTLFQGPQNRTISNQPVSITCSRNKSSSMFCSLDHIKQISFEIGLYPLDSLLPTKIIVTLPFEIVIFLKKNLL